MHQRLRLMVSLCRADNVTLDVTSVGSSHVSLTHCHPRDNWPAQDVALCLYYQMHDNTNSSRPVTSTPGSIFGGQQWGEQNGHWEYLLIWTLYSLNICKAPENVNGWYCQPSSGWGGRECVDITKETEILINRPLDSVLSLNSWQLLDTNKMSRGHCHEWGDHRESVPCHTSHLTLTRHCHDVGPRWQLHHPHSFFWHSSSSKFKRTPEEKIKMQTWFQTILLPNCCTMVINSNQSENQMTLVSVLWRVCCVYNCPGGPSDQGHWVVGVSPDNFQIQ